MVTYKSTKMSNAYKQSHSRHLAAAGLHVHCTLLLLLAATRVRLSHLTHKEMKNKITLQAQFRAEIAHMLIKV